MGKVRRIKFRGKTPAYCEAGGDWLYGDLWHLIDKENDKNAMLILPDDMDLVSADCKDNLVMFETVGQFTGLHDKNGREIYEDDIVQCGSDVCRVAYDDTRFASFVLINKKNMFKHYFGEAFEASDCEVIGNAHDNPELITVVI